MPVKVNLTPELLALAEQEAKRRQSVNETLGLRGRNKAPAVGGRALELHRLGCIGEVAAAAHFGLEEGLFTETNAVRGSADLPFDLEVKTRSRHSYDLIVQKNERKDKKLLLVTVEKDEVLIHGWCVAGDVMKPEFWSDPARGRPAYFVPKSQLLQLSDLELDTVAVESSGTENSG